MKFSTRAEYGLRAIVNLAKSYPEKKNLKAISIEEKISMKYLERLMGELRKKEIIKSLKGKNGGYILANRPENIKVGEIVEILEGPIAPMKCFDKICAIQNKCPASAVWMKLGSQIQKTLYGIKLSDLI